MMDDELIGEIVWEARMQGGSPHVGDGGIDKAIDALKQALPQWINIKKDGLPTEAGDYLVYGIDHHGSIIEGSDWFDTKYKGWWTYPIEAITHWMTLPEPPESEE
jgi:hypothetical protein